MAIPLLAEEFRNAVAKDKDLRMRTEAKTDVGYPTGLTPFDFMNGYVIHVNNEEKNIHQKYYCLGITDGSFNSIIGKSGSGKTTLCVQSAANIIRNFPTATCFIDTAEGGITTSRAEVLTGFHGEEFRSRFIMRNTGITAENFYKRIKMIHDIKLANPDQYMYDTGRLDIFGNPLWTFEPTVYILDSVAVLYPENMLDDEELKAASGMNTAKSTQVVTQLVGAAIQMLKSANIIVLSVNHIKEQIATGPFMKAPDVKYLKPGEYLPKGKAVTLLSNNIIRLDVSTKLKPTETFHVDGHIVNVSNMKSRSSAANHSVPLVFEQNTGFNSVLSIIQFLKESNRINGSGVGLYFDDNKEFKFALGNVLEKLENPAFRKVFENVAFDQLSKLCVDSFQLENVSKNNDITNSILSRLNTVNIQ
ncbi:MAG: hypothetical protein IJ193_00785 [Bacilli bacterium]|nr:hypothetical protein [Bacilli bacterium]